MSKCLEKCVSWGKRQRKDDFVFHELNFENLIQPKKRVWLWRQQLCICCKTLSGVSLRTAFVFLCSLSDLSQSGNLHWSHSSDRSFFAFIDSQITKFNTAHYSIPLLGGSRAKERVCWLNNWFNGKLFQLWIGGSHNMLFMFKGSRVLIVTCKNSCDLKIVFVLLPDSAPGRKTLLGRGPGLGLGKAKDWPLYPPASPPLPRPVTVTSKSFSHFLALLVKFFSFS